MYKEYKIKNIREELNKSIKKFTLYATSLDITQASTEYNIEDTLILKVKYKKEDKLKHTLEANVYKIINQNTYENLFNFEIKTLTKIEGLQSLIRGMVNSEDISELLNKLFD